MIMELLNILGCILTVIGTYLISLKRPKVFYTNVLYVIACILMILVFSSYENWAMVVMYNILAGFSIRGIVNQRRD